MPVNFDPRSNKVLKDHSPAELFPEFELSSDGSSTSYLTSFQSLSAFPSAAPGLPALAGAAKTNPTPAPLRTETVHVAGNVTFVNTYDNGVSDKFIACIVAAESLFENLWSGKNAVTVKVNFFESAAGVNNYVIKNNSSLYRGSFDEIKSAMPASDVLPQDDPSRGKGTVNWGIPTAYSRMLGINDQPEATDIIINLNSSIDWDYGPNLVAGVTHELTEGCGRIGGLGGVTTGDGVPHHLDRWSAMDFFHYTVDGKYDTTNGADGQTTYFSSDGGKTTSASAGLSFNSELYPGGAPRNSEDTADWSEKAVFGGYKSGAAPTLTQTELDVMSALGWKTRLPLNSASISGDWQTPTIWSMGATPIKPQDVYLSGSATSRIAVTSRYDVTVNSVGVRNATLTIDGGSTLVATNGSVLNPKTTGATSSANTGTVSVLTKATFAVGNKFSNRGSLNVGVEAGTGPDPGNLNSAAAFVLQKKVTLGGGGAIQLGGSVSGGNLSGLILGDGLVNVDNRIHGAGEIKLSSLVNQDKGSIIADQSGRTLEISTRVSDTGLLEATNGATLLLSAAVTTGQSYVPTSGVAPPKGGTIKATGGGTVEIAGAVTASPPATSGSSSVLGQVIADAGSRVVIQAGGSVAAPIVINGAGNGLAAGAVTVKSGGSITGAVKFKGGGTLDLGAYSGPVTVSGSGGAVIAKKAHITTAARSDVSLGGVRNTVTFGSDAVIHDADGGKTEFLLAPGIGAVRLYNFQNDPNGVIHLLDGLGGFASAADAFNALVSDKAGGEILRFAPHVSIHFVGDSQLTAANFKIG